MKSILAAVVALLAFGGSGHAQAVPPGTTWHWQLAGTVATDKPALLYDIDMEAATPALVAGLKSAGRIVICYFSAGTYESYRTDAKEFPASVKGRKLDDWDETYIDIRSPAVRRIMSARMDQAKAKGCNGFEPDVLDAWNNRSGFPITRSEQIEYVKWLAAGAHARGMIMPMKNGPEIATEVEPFVDFVIAEECFQYQACEAYLPYIQANKAVLNAEYAGKTGAKCHQAAAMGFSTAWFNLALDGETWEPCPPRG